MPYLSRLLLLVTTGPRPAASQATSFKQAAKYKEWGGGDEWPLGILLVENFIIIIIIIILSMTF